jgi:membrane-bound ClpP family serine protease
LVEITEQPLFAIGYGVLFVVLGGAVFVQAFVYASSRGFSLKESAVHLGTLFTIALVVFTSGVMCFALEKVRRTCLRRDDARTSILDSLVCFVAC